MGIKVSLKKGDTEQNIYCKCYTIIDLLKIKKV